MQLIRLCLAYSTVDSDRLFWYFTYYSLTWRHNYSYSCYCHIRIHMGNKPRKQRLAEGEVLTLYHQTSPKNADAIRREGKMLRGSSGLAGGGIYFAKSKEATAGKAHQFGVIITAKVKLGTVKTIYAHDPYITFTQLNNEGYDSVKIVRPGGAFYDEFVVYNYDQVEIIKSESTETRQSQSNKLSLYVFIFLIVCLLYAAMIQNN